MEITSILELVPRGLMEAVDVTSPVGGNVIPARPLVKPDLLSAGAPN
ncbi:MAG: hypothetical protein ABJL55_18895 [Roseibium sp.]